MAKRSRTKNRSAASGAAGEVGPRQPCPCGSGRRYKACHGSPSGPPPAFVARPFDGLGGECDIVAMREYIAAATAPLPLQDSVSTDRHVRLCTLLPMAVPAMVRQDGTVWLGLQVQHNYGDPSRDLAAVLLKALEAEPGDLVGLAADPGEGPRLQDLVSDAPLDVTVHEGFEFWVEDVEDEDGSLAASLDQANAAADRSARLTTVDAAYWTDVGSKEHLRWAMPHDEERLLSALARLHVAGKDVIVPEARLVGMFRAHGLLVPVWDLPVGTGPEALEQPAERFGDELAAVLEDASPLTADERAARSGLANRQLTLR